MRALYLLTDGFGGRGGIAQFNRALMRAICSFGGVNEVLALPRYISSDINGLPAHLQYDRAAASGKMSYLARVLGSALRGRRFDLIVCAHLNLQPLAVLARWLSGARSVLVLHGIEAWTPPASGSHRMAAGRTDWVAAVSQFTLDRFSAWSHFPNERSAVLPCSVDLTRFAPGRPDPAVLEKYRISQAQVILSVGRLARAERYKGIDELLEVLASLRARDPSIVCVIAGSGDDRPRLEAKARELGVAEHVRFTGYVPESELVGLYRAARAFVLAGYGEGFGIVLLEAMACGVPAVASTLDGSFEAIGRGALGIAVNPRDRASLASGILEALRRPIGMRPSGIEDFSDEMFEARAHQLLDRAMTDRRSAA